MAGKLTIATNAIELGSAKAKNTLDGRMWCQDTRGINSFKSR